MDICSQMPEVLDLLKTREILAAINGALGVGQFSFLALNCLHAQTFCPVAYFLQTKPEAILR